MKLAIFLLALVASALAAPVINQALVEEINAKEAGWTAKLHSRFSNMEESEVKKLLGTKLDFTTGSLPVQKYSGKAELPASFDSRTNWASCDWTVRDQAQCGSCWAFGAAESLSDRFCTQLTTTVELSPQNLVSCDNTDDGCDGGYLQNAWEFMASTGLVDIACMPYTSGGGDSGTCPSSCTGTGDFSKKYHAKNVRAIDNNEQAIMEEIQKNGPAEVAFSVYSDFMSYSSGVYTHQSGGLLGGHAVKAVGWGVTDDGTKYWIIANSWGASWGLQGFFWIARGTDECGIEDNVVAGDAGTIDSVAVIPQFSVDDEADALDDDMIVYVNSLKTTWHAEHNSRFHGKSMKEAKKLMGAKLGRPEGTHTPVMLHSDAIPDSFDARTKWASCVHPIRNQDQCGSCWAFGASEAFSDRVCIAGGDNVVLSPQELVSCDTTDMGCNGGYLQNAWQFMAGTGVVVDSCYPYTSGGGDSGSCASTCQDGSAFKPYFVDASSIVTLSDEKSIQTAIMTNGPVEASFSVYADFMSYSSGVYSHKTGGLMGGHAIKVVGWSVTDDGTPYWIVANSWDVTWGIDGFFWILRGSNECSIESNVVCGLPKQ